MNGFQIMFAPPSRKKSYNHVYERVLPALPSSPLCVSTKSLSLVDGIKKNITRCHVVVRWISRVLPKIEDLQICVGLFGKRVVLTITMAACRRHTTRMHERRRGNESECRRGHGSCAWQRSPWYKISSCGPQKLTFYTSLLRGNPQN